MESVKFNLKNLCICYRFELGRYFLFFSAPLSQFFFFVSLFFFFFPFTFFSNPLRCDSNDYHLCPFLFKMFQNSLVWAKNGMFLFSLFFFPLFFFSLFLFFFLCVIWWEKEPDSDEDSFHNTYHLSGLTHFYFSFEFLLFFFFHLFTFVSFTVNFLSKSNMFFFSPRI